MFEDEKGKVGRRNVSSQRLLRSVDDILGGWEGGGVGRRVDRRWPCRCKVSSVRVRERRGQKGL